MSFMLSMVYNPLQLNENGLSNVFFIGPADPLELDECGKHCMFVWHDVVSILLPVE